MDRNPSLLTMTDFAEFDDIFTQYGSHDDKQDKMNSSPNESSSTMCQHVQTVQENGTLVCVECGEQMRHSIMHEKEWRYYGPSDGKHGADPNRVHIRKVEEKSIHRDVDGMGFSESIVTKANNLYSQVTEGKIYRGNSRKAIIFACIFYAYKISDKYQPPENLIKLFGLNLKCGHRGLKIVNVCAPKDSQIHTASITSEHLIYSVMDKFKATDRQKNEVMNLYNATKNRSSRLNRARPQSVAAALTYYWICEKKMDISLKEFSAKVELSQLTINKNVKEIRTILGTTLP